MQIEDTLARIGQCGVVAVIRGVAEEALEHTVDAVVAGGVDCVEIAMSVHGALRDITVLKDKLGDRVIIGAGEVLNGEMATLAHAAQADFCSGIGANKEMVRACIERDMLPIPGALTPTEIQFAWHAGATLVKLFPAEMFDAEYVETVRRVLHRVSVMPSGGISAENASKFIRAGAHSVGSGRSIIDTGAIARRDFEAIARNAATIREAVLAARQQ